VNTNDAKRARVAEEKLGMLAYHFMCCEAAEIGACKTGPKRFREKHHLHAKIYRAAARDVLKAINGKLRSPNRSGRTPDMEELE